MYKVTTRPTEADILRTEQIDEARRRASEEGEAIQPRRTLSVARTDTRPARANEAPGRKPGGPATRVPLKGHEAFLKALELSGADVVIEKISSGAKMTGRIKHSDKFTVTLRSDDGIERVIYKHDISEFYTTTPRSDPVFGGEGAA